MVWLVLGLVGVVGCEEPLFTETMPRTQYERYDRLRGRHVPAEQFDRPGTDPALRERLGSTY